MDFGCDEYLFFNMIEKNIKGYLKKTSTQCIIYLEVIKRQFWSDDCASDSVVIYSYQLSSNASRG